MKIRFLRLAQSEVDDAVAWYDAQSRSLGTQFLDDLDHAVRRIATYPLSNTIIEEEIRRCLLTRFPYKVIYGVDSETIVIIAVAHLHREPRYWIERLSGKN